MFAIQKLIDQLSTTWKVNKDNCHCTGHWTTMQEESRLLKFSLLPFAATLVKVISMLSKLLQFYSLFCSQPVLL